MEVVESFAAVRRLLEHRDGVAGLVPTMGFLHEGHAAHMERCASECDITIVSLFVNPLQFDDAADLERYPRDPDRDASVAARAGTDVLFVPPVDEMYAEPPLTRVTVDPLTVAMEGAHRPGHFAGVATVVAKLLAGIRPDRAYFGRKDAQQLAVVSRMALDLSFPVEIVGGSTVREADGLALSSRNVFLRPDEREDALALSRGLFAASDAAEAGERSAAALEDLVTAELHRAGGARPEYVTLAGAATAEPIPRLDRPSFLAVAAAVGRVRLIDNVFLTTDGSGAVDADRGVRLDGPSMLYGGT